MRLYEGSWSQSITKHEFSPKTRTPIHKLIKAYAKNKVRARWRRSGELTTRNKSQVWRWVVESKPRCAASWWVRVMICWPKWQVCNGRRIAYQVWWRATMTSSSVKNEDEEKGSLAGSSKTEIFRDSAKHSVSNALFCSFFGLIMRLQNDIVEVIQFFFVHNPVRVCKIGRVIGSLKTD